jgi:hypothetical protein
MHQFLQSFVKDNPYHCRTRFTGQAVTETNDGVAQKHLIGRILQKQVLSIRSTNNHSLPFFGIFIQIYQCNSLARRNFSKSSGISHCERHAAQAPALRERSNLLDSVEIASSLALLAMTKNHSFRKLPEFIEMLRPAPDSFCKCVYFGIFFF